MFPIWAFPALALLLCAQASATDVPFNSTIVGKQFLGVSDCFSRFRSTSLLTANARTIVFQPPFCGRCQFNPDLVDCSGLITLHFTRRTSHPYIVKRFFTSINIKQNPKARCGAHPRTETYWPWGPGRAKFIKAFKEIAAGAIFIRDFKCGTGDFPPLVPSKPNEARYIVNYLLALSWDFYFSIV